MTHIVHTPTFEASRASVPGGFALSRRGFSTLEVVIALTLFLSVATSLLSVSLQSAAAAVRTEARLATTRALEDHLDSLAESDFDALVSNSFTAPDACPDNTLESCVTVADTLVRIGYDVSASSDTINGAGASSPSVSIRGTAVSPDGTSFSLSRRVAAPLAGFSSSTSTLRVRAVPYGSSSSLSDALPPVLVMNKHGVPVSDSVPFSDGVAVVRLAGDACSGDAAPCRIALSASPTSWFTTGSWTLPYSDIMSAGSIVTSPGSLTQVTLMPSPTAALKLVPYANASLSVGMTPAPAHTAGTVCVWARFSANGVARTVPYCNTDVLDGTTEISLAAWPLTVDSTTYYVPFASGTQLQLFTDHPDGICPRSGSGLFPAPGSGYQGGYPSGYVSSYSTQPADVCTSWTWGVPSSLVSSTGSTVAMSAGSAPLALPESGSATFKLVWADESGATYSASRPATGSLYSGGLYLPWTKPRTLPFNACVTDTAAAPCASSITTIPELAAGCVDPARFCLSGVTAAPFVTLSSSADGWSAIPVTYAGDSPTGGQPTPVTLKAYGPEPGKTMALTFLSLPAHGQLVLGNGQPAAANTAYDVSTAAAPALNLTFNPVNAANAAIPFSTFNVLITDSDGRTSVKTFALYPPAKIGSLPFSTYPRFYVHEFSSADPIVVRQGDSNAAIPLSVVDANRTVKLTSAAALAGQVVSIVPAASSPELSARVSNAASLSASVDATAKVAFTVPILDTPAGFYTLALRSADPPGPVSAVPVTVLPTAGELTMSSAAPLSGPNTYTLAQGSSLAVSFTLRDLHNDPMPGQTINVATTFTDGTVSTLVRPDAGSCVTDSAGVCSVTVTIAPNAGSAIYTLSAAHRDGVSSSVFLSVAKKPSQIVVAGRSARSDAYQADTATYAGGQLAGYWPLDDQSGTTATGLVGSGSYTGSVTLGADRIAAGAATSAAGFGGDGAKMCSANVALDGPSTIEAWVRPDLFKTGRSPHVSEVWGTETATASFGLRFGDLYNPNGNTIQLLATLDGVQYKVDAPAKAQLGRSYHLVGTWDGTRLRLYVNGTLAAERAVSTVTPADFGGVYCVANFSGIADPGAGSYDRFLAGIVDEVALYHGALSSGAVERRYALGSEAGSRANAIVGVAQGASQTTVVRVLDASGAPVPGVTVSASTPSTSVTVSSSVSTNFSGEATFALAAAASTPAGLLPDPITFAVVSADPEAPSLRANVQVSPTFASVSTTGAVISRGGRTAVALKVLDTAGAPMPSAALNVALSDPAGLKFASMAYADASGDVLLPMSADFTAAVSARVVSLTHPSVSTPVTFPLTVTDAVSGFQVVETSPLPQGGSAAWKLRLLGADSTPIVGVVPAASCTACGLTFSATASDADGFSVLTIADPAPTNPRGVYTVDISVQGAVSTEQLTVVASPTSLTPVDLAAGASVSTAAGSALRVPLVVKDATGRALANAPVVGVSSDGMTVSGATSSAGGRAEVELTVPASLPPGSYTVTFSSGAATTALTVVVA